MNRHSVLEYLDIVALFGVDDFVLVSVFAELTFNLVRFVGDKVVNLFDLASLCVAIEQALLKCQEDRRLAGAVLPFDGEQPLSEIDLHLFVRKTVSSLQFLEANQATSPLGICPH